MPLPNLPAADRGHAVDSAVTRIHKLFGDGAIIRMDGSAARDVPVISTGCLGLDLALGIGGVPRGRVVEIYGPEASGKTTLTLQLIAEAQRAGGTAAFIDAEHALDATYAGKLGVDVESLLLSQPDSGEQALEIVDILVRSGGVDLVVVDSVAALTPRAEIEGEMGDHHVGAHARLMSQAMRKLAGAASRTGTTVVFINQIRMKIGVMFGSPETTTGGQALKFYSSVRIDIRRIATIKDDKKKEVLGSRTRIKVVKNKLAPPFRQVEVDIRFGRGIVHSMDLLERGVDLEIIQRRGAWFQHAETRLGQGKDNASAYLEAHPDLAESLRLQILQAVGLGTPAEIPSA
jgi:recombination protein RecA